MSLKILILPTLIILEVIIAIGYIKPNIDDILAKQIEIQTAKDGLSRESVSRSRVVRRR